MLVCLVREQGQLGLVSDLITLKQTSGPKKAFSHQGFLACTLCLLVGQCALHFYRGDRTQENSGGIFPSIGIYRTAWCGKAIGLLGVVSALPEWLKEIMQILGSSPANS